MKVENWKDVSWVIVDYFAVKKLTSSVIVSHSMQEMQLTTEAKINK